MIRQTTLSTTTQTAAHVAPTAALHSNPTGGVLLICSFGGFVPDAWRVVKVMMTDGLHVRFRGAEDDVYLAGPLDAALSSAASCDLAILDAGGERLLVNVVLTPVPGSVAGASPAVQGGVLPGTAGDDTEFS
jgi:hypothetical protein